MSSLPSRTMKFVPSLLPILTVGLLAAAATGQANVAEYPFDDGFEGVQLGTGWSWGGDGLVPAKVTSLYDPHSDAQHLQLGGLDEDGAVGHTYGAKTTPQMFVIDPDGKIAYAGAVDNAPLGQVEG